MRMSLGHSHDDLRAPVEKAGIRFYPMKGNARQMAGWGPSFSLHIPTLLKIALDVQKTSTQLTVIRQIILATVKACTEADPEDQNCEPFHADCIMQWWTRSLTRPVACPLCTAKQEVPALAHSPERVV